MNKVILVGRLTRDPEVRYTSESQMAVARFSIAIDRPVRRDGGEQQTDFPNIVAFGRNGEFAEKYLRKGTRILVEGRIQTGSYTNKDGNKVYTTDVVVENFQFLDTKGSRNMDSVDMPTNDDIPNDEPTGDSSDPFADFGAKIEVSDSELPF